MRAAGRSSRGRWGRGIKATKAAPESAFFKIGSIRDEAVEGDASEIELRSELQKIGQLDLVRDQSLLFSGFPWATNYLEKEQK